MYRNVTIEMSHLLLPDARGSAGLTHRPEWYPTFAQMEVLSEGSCGHPDLCGRPCVHFVRGKCERLGSD